MSTTTEQISLFGANGQLAGTYRPTVGGTTLTFAGLHRVYFGRKLIKWIDGSGTHNPLGDRLGSVGRYYPYGEDRNAETVADHQVKFATYTRYSAAGLDYADQRYYSSSLARFEGDGQVDGQRVAAQQADDAAAFTEHWLFCSVLPEPSATGEPNDPES